MGTCLAVVGACRPAAVMCEHRGDPGVTAARRASQPAELAVPRPVRISCDAIEVELQSTYLYL